MSKFTDFAENSLADMMRGIPWSLPATLYLGLASSAADNAFLELTGTGYARQPLDRSLATWAGTQNAGTITSSLGSTHLTSNNNIVDFGTAGSAWGTANFVVLFTALTGGNPIAFIPITTRIINTTDAISFAAASISITLGLTGGCSDYLANKLIDFIFRGQSYTWPGTTYIALCTSAPNNAGGGTEVPSLGSYARKSLLSTTTALSGTQGPGTTSASTGSSGIISNNAALVFPTPLETWGNVVYDKQMDAPTGGNMLFYGQLNSPRSVVAGNTPVTYAAGSYQTTIA